MSSEVKSRSREPNYLSSTESSNRKCKDYKEKKTSTQERIIHRPLNSPRSYLPSLSKSPRKITYTPTSSTTNRMSRASHRIIPPKVPLSKATRSLTITSIPPANTRASQADSKTSTPTKDSTLSRSASQRPSISSVEVNSTTISRQSIKLEKTLSPSATKVAIIFTSNPIDQPPIKPKNTLPPLVTQPKKSPSKSVTFNIPHDSPHKKTFMKQEALFLNEILAINHPNSKISVEQFLEQKTRKPQNINNSKTQKQLSNKQGLPPYKSRVQSSKTSHQNNTKKITIAVQKKPQGN